MPNYLSAGDLLAGIIGNAIDYDVPGLGTIQLRALSFAEAAQINQLGGDAMAINRAALKAGIVSPALSDDQVEQLMSANVSVIAGIVQKILQLSGMNEDEELKK